MDNCISTRYTGKYRVSFFSSHTMQTETQESAHKFKENGKHLASLVGETAVAN